MQSRIFWFAFITITVVSFLASINLAGTYESRMQIILLPKNEGTAQKIDHILSNAENIASTLFFYDDIAKNEEVENPVLELPANKRKEYWQSKINVRKIFASDMLSISASDQNQIQAEIINRQAVHALISRLSQYYNIKTELDIRIIEEPIVKPTLVRSVWLLIVLSLLAGLFCGLIVYAVYSILPPPKISKGRTYPDLSSHLLSKMDTDSRVVAEKELFLEISKEEPPYFEKIDQKEKRKPDVEAAIKPEKKAVAPGNLPVADENSLFDLREKTLEKEPKMDMEKRKTTPGPEENVFREATPEEVKDRLNKLLSGKF